MQKSKIILTVLPALLFLTACSGGGGASSPSINPGSNASTTTLPTKITLASVPMILDPTQVPPDPGPAGDATVAGIDSKGVGIRDDVQRWIAKTYPNSAIMRAAAAQIALTTQKQITTPGMTSDTAYQLGATDVNAVCCLIDSSSLTGLPDKLKEIKIAQLNTRQRANAYSSFQRRMGSRAFLIPKGDTCDVSSSSLPN